ncbi:hypothetical protein TSUD_88040 [Trifolium subterraneum]|uniref:Uncharacterized protein n=1 Tax=Trifolium subterraneum TaxID=3900 RepID=A0A2Z6P6C2_TRISU|nr:hypothetical protein TSUD_88040 [Trifolium subterraneum]
MAVGKRLWSRDEHLMLIIPMLGVTNLRGDVRCSTVRRCWTCTLGLARRTLPDRWIFAPFGFCDGRVWTVGLSFIVAVGLTQRSRLEWRPKVRADRGLSLKPLAIPCDWISSFKLSLSIQPSFLRTNMVVEVCQRWLTPSSSHKTVVLAKTTDTDVPSIHNVFPGIHEFRVPENLKIKDFPLGFSYVFDSSIDGNTPGISALGSSYIRIYLLEIFLSVMANDGIQRKIPVEDNMDWVADDPRTTTTRFELGEHYPEDLFTEIEEQDLSNWEIRIPGARQRICTAYRNGGIPIRILRAGAHHSPIFRHLRNPALPAKGKRDEQMRVVSLKQHRKFFDIYEESLRNFKDEYFVVRPMAVDGWKTILVRGPKLDDDGNVLFGDDAEPIEVDCERFPFCWSTKHYSREAKSFTFRRGALSKEESADLKVLEDFVDSFPPNLWEDREGNPICDEEGVQLSSKKFVNTKALLKARLELKLRICFVCEMKSTAASLRKLQADKKRRQAGGVSSSAPIASGQSSPTPSIEVTGESRVAEEIIDDQRPPKHARVEGGGGVVSGPRRLMPGKAVAEFVLPPAMGHDCLLDGKTTVKIPEADQTILASMGLESLRNVVAESSVAVFKLLEVVTFLNGRECKYLRERDEARALAKDFGERLTVVEQDLLARGKALEDSEAEVAKVKKGLEDAKGEEEKLKGKIAELEEQVSGLSLVEEEEKKLDPAGTFAKFSRADLIAKIYQIGDMQLDVASSSFQNALAQLQVLNLSR